MEYREIIDAFNRFATAHPVELNVEDPFVQAFIADGFIYPISDDDLNILQPFFDSFYDEYFRVGSNELHINSRLVDSAILRCGNLCYVTFANLQQREDSIMRLRRVIVSFEYVVDKADGFYEKQKSR